MTRILVADDDVDTLDALKMVIEEETAGAHDVVGVYSGKEAIYEIQRAAGNRIFQVVVTDFQMGQGPDGVDVATEAVRRSASRVFINTGHLIDDRTPLGRKLLHAEKCLPGVKVVPKMDFHGLQKHVFSVLKPCGTKPAKK